MFQTLQDDTDISTLTSDLTKFVQLVADTLDLPRENVIVNKKWV